jgi:hypothetical protein
VRDVAELDRARRRATWSANAVAAQLQVRGADEQRRAVETVVVDQPLAVAQHAAVRERAVGLAGARAQHRMVERVVLDVAHAAAAGGRRAGAASTACRMRSAATGPRPATGPSRSCPRNRARDSERLSAMTSSTALRRRVVDLPGLRAPARPATTPA